MKHPEITVYGAYWCPDCRRSKKFLGEQFIPYKWVDIEQDKRGEQFVLEINQGKRIIPTIVFGDGSFLVEPSNAELARKLGLKTEARMTYYDLVVIGGDLCRARGDRDPADRALRPGRPGGTYDGHRQLPRLSCGCHGQELTERMVEQAKRFNVEILQAQNMVKLGWHDGYNCILNDEDKHHHARAVLIATGASYRRLDVPGDRMPFAFETSAPGVFAAGDVRHGSTKQVASAVGEGAAAALMVREYLKTV